MSTPPKPKPTIGMGWMVTGPLMAAFACMVYLTGLKSEDPARSPEPATGREPVAWEESLSERIEALTKALEASGVELTAPVEERKGSGALRWVHRLYDVAASKEEEATAEEGLASLRQVDPGVTVTSKARFDGVDVLVGLDGLLTHTVRFRWKDQERRPRVAIVLAPLGDDLRMARECVSLEAPVAIAVEPFRPFSKEVAELGRIFEREILVYITPADSDVGSTDDPAPSDTLKQALEAIPNAIGVTGADGNGRAAAELRGRLHEEVNRLGLFYVRMQATEQPTTGPPIFILNGEQLTEPLAEQFSKLIAKARAVGAVVGISRPSPQILAILPEQLREWQADGVEIVPVSKLATPTGLSAG